MPTNGVRRLGMIVAVGALVLAACGGDDDDQTSVGDSTSTTTTTGPSTALPGEPTDIGPPVDGTVAVAGVAFDDVLNVRAVPGASNPVVTTLSPTATATATGNNRILDDKSFWYELKSGGMTGWASARFLFGQGTTDDITAQVISTLGSRPTAKDMRDLGRVVADSQASDEPQSKIVLVVAASSGDLGEVIYDVIGFGDDSIGGARLHVFGSPSGGGFSLKSVESTTWCSRGFGAPGSICV